MVSAVRCLSISTVPPPPPSRLAMPATDAAVSSSSSSSPRSCRVAVIGAGAAGLVAARELRRVGHGVAVFERGDGVGGTWIYTDETESDPLGLDPTREIVHSSLYESLRTNLSRECMGFLDYPFVAAGGGDGRDPRRFPGHREVLRYLEDFAKEFEVLDLLRLRTEVMRVEMAGEGKWKVKSRRRSEDNRGGAKVTEEEEEVYDAVVVCNGHYTEPQVADISGIDAWPGKQIHSHNYRVPEPFRDQVVVIIGCSASAVDISRDIAGFAKEVHFASRSETEGTPKRQPGYDNMWLHSMIEKAHESGVVSFQDGSSFRVDVIMHCTGYKFHFPFLETNGIVNVDDNRVGPLYKHVFPPLLAPHLSFTGLPWKVIPFPLVELQSKWIAAVLSGRVALPTQKEMMEDVEAFYAEMEIAGMPKRYTHNMAQYQFEYVGWVTNECGCPAIEEWRKLMFMSTAKSMKERPESYRDEWEDGHLVEQALQDFNKFLR